MRARCPVARPPRHCQDKIPALRLLHTICAHASKSIVAGPRGPQSKLVKLISRISPGPQKFWCKEDRVVTRINPQNTERPCSYGPGCVRSNTQSSESALHTILGGRAVCSSMWFMSLERWRCPSPFSPVERLDANRREYPCRFMNEHSKRRGSSFC